MSMMKIIDKRACSIISFSILFVYLAVCCLTLAGCTKQYTSKETGKQLSEEMTDVIQVGLIGKAAYTTMIDWKDGLCSVRAVSERNCYRLDGALRIFNSALTAYGEDAVAWYIIESNPNSTMTIDKKFASQLVWGLWRQRENLMSGASNVAGKNVFLPQLQVMDAILSRYDAPCVGGSCEQY